MYSDWSAVVWILMAVVLVWLGFLSYLVWQQGRFLKSILPSSGELDFRKKFAEVIKAVEYFDGSLNELVEKVSKVRAQGLKHIQRVSLLRYNPFDDTGGDQSFSAAFLDKSGTGVIITSLHARSGTRVFAKPVVKGDSGNYQFSKEEKLAIKEALE